MLIVCLAWIVAFAWLLLSGWYLGFLARGYWPLLAMGGLALTALAAAVALRGVPGPHGRAGARAAWLPLAICLVPLAFLVADPRPTPSSFSLAMRAEVERLWKTQTALGLANLPPPQPPASPSILPPGPGPAPGQAATSAAATSQGATTQADSPERLTIVGVFLQYPRNVGQQVELIGTVSRQPGMPAGTFVLFRFFITCCAADARPTAVLVALPAGRAGDAPKADTWVRLRGTVARTSFRGLDMPVVNAREITPIPPPANPYD